MRICILDQCSRAKTAPDWFDPFRKEDLAKASREELLSKEDVPTYRARDLYDGRQQQNINKAVDRLRSSGDEVDRLFLSAGFGLVDEDVKLPPYDVTFSGCSSDEIEDRASHLGIQHDLKRHFENSSSYDLIFLPLGKNYLTALDFPTILGSLASETKIVVFNQAVLAENHENMISIPANNEQAKKFGKIVVELKGWYIYNFAEYRSREYSVESIDDVRTYCTREFTTQHELDDYQS